MSNRMDKFLSSRFATIALVGVAVLVGMFLFGGGSLFSNGRGIDKATISNTSSVAEIPVAKLNEDQFKPSSEDNLTEDLLVSSASAVETDTAMGNAGKIAMEDSNSTPALVEPAPVEATSVSNRRAPVEPAPVLVAASEPGGANSFNRLLKRPSSSPNAPPARDGIHDAANPGTALLQWPSVAFEGLPKTNDGNKIDWVKSLQDEKIAPRYELDNPKADPFLLDLVIIRQVKGSMPNVVYPHLQHTQWLDCSNCHDEIFTPQKGANQISMAGILLGQKCGVCHGKVAFPVSDCRRCHAQPKTAQELKSLADRSNWASEGG